MKNITLYYREGSSDKMYQAAIEPKDSGYIVTFAYGRRGSTLNTGTKTSTPVNYDEAQRIYQKLIKEKTAKGYTPGESGTRYQSTGMAGRSSGISCQLLNAITEDQLAGLIANPAYWLQEKFDGRRMLVRKSGHTITGINRLGLMVALPAPLIADAMAYEGDFLLDGESIGDVLHAFDLLSLDGHDLRCLGFGERYLKLMNLLASFQHRHIALVRSACLPRHKQAMFDELKAQNKEGVVFKNIDASYTPGKPASAGPQLKFKFCETASFIVTKANAKRSVSLILFHGDKVVSAGNVTIPGNHDIPLAGSVVECRYLYAFPESGCIYQPVYLGVRDDIPSKECTTDQLKYKTGELQAAA